MMTPEEIKEAQKQITACVPHVTKRIAIKSLSSLTEAYAEIERLETRLHKVIGCAHSVVSPGHLEGCPLWAKLPTESTT